MVLTYLTKLFIHSNDFFLWLLYKQIKIERIMTTISSPHFTSSHDVKNAEIIKYKRNPLIGLVKKDKEGEIKRAALTGSIVATLLYMLALSKSIKKRDFKIKDMFNIDFKNMFKVMGLATSSVIGGLTGGLIADDKENYKPKIKEAIHQFLGNIVTPITIVGIAAEEIEKRKFSKTKEIAYSALAAVTGVISGVTAGNWAASKVNNIIFNEHDDRKLKAKDFSIHVDDLLTVAALTPIGDSIKGFTAKALPSIFLICGYEAGTKKVHKKDIKQEINK